MNTFYHRDIAKKIISLRVVSIILLFFCVRSFLNLHNNLGYFLSVVVFFLLFVIIKDFRIKTDCLQVKKYYLFGFLPITWTFRKTDIDYEFHGSAFGQDTDPVFHDDSESGLGCLFFILSLGLPYKITGVNFKIYSKTNRSVFRTVHILLNRKEYDKLFDFVNCT